MSKTQSSPLQRIINTPMKRLRFRDFTRLKVGVRDKYSNVRLKRLKEMVPDHFEVETALDDEKAVASCLRWILRGLPLHKAIRKVKTDLEVAENAKTR